MPRVPPPASYSSARNARRHLFADQVPSDDVGFPTGLIADEDANQRILCICRSRDRESEKGKQQACG